MKTVRRVLNVNLV